MVANLDLHGTYFEELPFIPQGSLLLSTFLGLTHLVKYDLLGLWASTQNQVHPPTLVMIQLHCSNLITFMRTKLCFMF